MKFSIITISRNQGMYIKKCIDSVSEQLHNSYEHIIIDANSDDNTHEILKNYNNNNLIFKIGKDKGPADGLNKGCDTAKGEIYHVLNSDDYLLPGALEKIEAEFDKNTELQVVIAPIIIVDGEEKILKKEYPGYAFPRKYVNEVCVIFQQGVFFKSSLFDKTLGFNLNNDTNWDGELLMDLLKNISMKNISRIDFETGAFRIHSNSITGSNSNRIKYKENQIRLFKKVYGQNKNINKFRKYMVLLVQIISDPKWSFYKIKNFLKYKF